MSYVVERLLLRERLAGQNFEAANRLLDGFETARRFHGVGAKELNRKSGIVGRSVDRDHGAAIFTVSGSIDQHVVCAHRMADQHGGAQSPTVDNLLEVRNVIERAVLPFLGPFTLPMAALIKRENVKIRHKGRRNEIPPMSMRGTAVYEKHGRFSFATMVEAVEDQSVSSKTKFLHVAPRLSGYIPKQVPNINVLAGAPLQPAPFVSRFGSRCRRPSFPRTASGTVRVGRVPY